MATRTERFDLRALLESSRLLASSLDVEFVLNSLLLTTMSKLLVTRGVIFLHDPLAGGFRIEAFRGRFVGKEIKKGDVLRFEHGEEATEGEEQPRALQELGLQLALPITYHDRRIGLLAVGPKATKEGFTNEEREFAYSLVNMSATALHNVWVVEELKQANRELGHKVQQLNTLFDLAQGFNANPDAEQATHMLSLTLMGQFLVRKFAILVKNSDDGESLEVVAGRNVPTLDPAALKSLGNLRLLQILDDDAPVEMKALVNRGFSIALPLRINQITRGVLLLGAKGNRTSYDADEIDFLTALGQLTLTAIENARGIAAQLENERLEETIRLARSIQEKLLPQTLPKIEGAEIAAINLASQVVAGDYYDVIALDDGRLLIAVADVSGKGLPASLLMANLQACLHVLAASLSAGTVDLSTATSRINRVIHRNTGITTFITFFWGIFNPADGSLIYVNAGHNPPLLARRGGNVEELEKGGTLLGILRDVEYEEGKVTMNPGDSLALYTDGITEAWSATDSDDEFGEERLAKVIAADKSAAELAADVQRAVRAHTHNAPLDDDFTLVVLRRTS